MPKVIGITGRAGHGKDAIALSLGAALGSCLKFTFADPIRQIASALGLNITDREAKEQEVTLRFGHFEVSLIDAMVEQLEDFVGEEDLCDLYASFVTILRAREYLTTQRQDVLTISPRRFCQLLGTEGGRAVRQSFWVDVFRARVAKSRALYVVAPDVRFVNEALVCDLVIGVTRPDAALVAEHDSEEAIPGLVAGADTIYRNEGTLEDLNRYAIGVADAIKRGEL